jgi:hypothetical protein
MLQQRGEDNSCEPKNVQRMELQSQSVLEPNPIASAHSPGHSWASEPVSTISSRNSKAAILCTVQDILDLDVVIQTMHCNVIAFYASPPGENYHMEEKWPLMSLCPLMLSNVQIQNK